MLIVVDANIVFSSLIAGNITELFLSPKLDLIAPELPLLEIKKHKEELKQKSSFSEEDFEIILSFLEKRITIVPLDEFISYMPEAERLLGNHKKDAPCLALALKYRCPAWSYEKLFKDIGEIQSLTTADIAKIVKKYWKA